MQDTFGGLGLELRGSTARAAGERGPGQGLYDAAITPPRSPPCSAGRGAGRTWSSRSLTAAGAAVRYPSAPRRPSPTVLCCCRGPGRGRRGGDRARGRTVVARRDVELTDAAGPGGRCGRVVAPTPRAAAIVAIPGTSDRRGPGRRRDPGRRRFLAAWLPRPRSRPSPRWPAPLIAGWRYRRPAPASNSARITTPRPAAPRRGAAWSRR